MNDRPWIAEHVVPPERAIELIGRQFPALAPVRVERLGVGWDNTAYRANGCWVFRFPRRAVAAALIETEASVLPVIAGALPLAVPVPTMVGSADGDYPWPFSGYRMIDGRTACHGALDETRCRDAAAPLGAFLAALHAIDPGLVARHGAGHDTIRRLDLASRSPQIIERLDRSVAQGLLKETRPWREIVDETPADWSPARSTLVHGDLYARHLLVNADARLCGVIDWGDVHLGDAAVDLAIAQGFLPPSGRDAFTRAYGTVTDDVWRVARFRALHHALAILLYGHDMADDALVREGRTALHHLAM